MSGFLGGIGDGLASLGKWAVGSDGIGGKSGAVGSVGDFFTGTADTRTFDPMGNATGGSAGSKGLFGSVGNFIESNPNTTNAAITGLGGLAQYQLGKENARITDSYYNGQLAAQTRAQDLEDSEINRAHAKEDKQTEDFNSLTGYYFGQTDPYKQYAV